MFYFSRNEPDQMFSNANFQIMHRRLVQTLSHIICNNLKLKTIKAKSFVKKSII